MRAKLGWGLLWGAIVVSCFAGHSRKAAAGNEDTAAIRAWAKSSGYNVSDRGRVPAEIREAYQKAK